MPSSSSRKRSSLWRTRSSWARRSVRSRVILENPRSSPSGVKSAVMTTLAQKRVPSLRTRQPSSSKRPTRFASSSSRSGQRLATDALGLLQLVLRPAAVDVGLAVKDREMLADDLGGGVTLDALGARVPGRDAALGVEQEDRVVGDAVYGPAQQVLALVGQEGGQWLLVVDAGSQVGRFFSALRGPSSSVRRLLSS